MRLDREDGVAVHALHVCGHLLSLDMLEPEDCVQVCELVFVENRAISHAAGEFAVRYLFSEDFMARAKQAKVPKGESGRVYSLLLLSSPFTTVLWKVAKSRLTVRSCCVSWSGSSLTSRSMNMPLTLWIASGTTQMCSG